MLSKLLRLICSIVALGLLFTPNAWTAPGVAYHIPPPLPPQLSSDGNSLYYATPPVVYVADPNPSAERVRIPARFDLLSSPESAIATFSITYVASGGTDPWGASCTTFPEEAKTAFTAAAAIWGNILQSSVPITIRACWSNLGSPTTLGYSGVGVLHRNFTGAPLTNTWYGASLANALAGSDLALGSFDMHITYNSTFSWYYGTDGSPSSAQMDLMTVVLHEIAHGLNFSGSMLYAGGTGSWGNVSPPTNPDVYDTFMRDGSGNQLIDTGVYANPSTALGSALTSDNVWFHGSNAMAANGGQRVKMYAPSTWLSGSSYAHLDYNTFYGTTNKLMVFALSAGSAIHDPGPIATGILRDVGWSIGATLRETEPNNTFPQANEFQLNGQEFAGQLYSGSDVDVFKFNVAERGVLSFFIKPENSTGTGSIRATIKDSSLNILASKELTSVSTGIYLKANVATSGDYYLVIDQMPGNPTGVPIFDKDYQITPSIQTDSVSITHREIEPNNTFPQDYTFFLTNGEIYSAQLYGASDVDIFKYYVEAPGMLSFFIKPENTSGTGSLRNTIKDSSLNILASKELTSNSSGIYLQANVASSGDYYLVVDKMPDGNLLKPIFDKDYQITPNSSLQTGGTIIIHPYPDTINAPWALTRQSGYNRSGTGNETITDLTPGDYTITWGDLPGGIKPSPVLETKTLISGGTITFSATYAQQLGGSLAVTISMISPQGTIDAGGQWRRVGTTTWFNSGSTETGIPFGSYTVEFKAVAGWTTPSSVAVTISNGVTTTASGTYVRELIPIIQVTPISLGFGYVPVGSTKDRSLTVKNLGGWFYLTGNATTAPPFSIVQGDYYNLGPDQSQIVTVRYQPTSEGPHTGTVVFTGGGGAIVQVSGNTGKPLGLPWLMLLLD
jgi:hypothetical protein